MVIGLRSAWILRTPDFVAEEQWQLLRSILTRMTGQQPGSSRPLDVEAGLRPDLITHPHGETRRRGVTLDGRMGPAWPDAYSVTRTIRRGRLKVLLTLSLIIVKPECRSGDHRHSGRHGNGWSSSDATIADLRPAPGRLPDSGPR